MTRMRLLVRAAGAATTGRLGRVRALLDLERVATAARGDRVRVVDREARGLDRVEVVDLGAAQIRRAERVDDDVDAVHRELEVALLRAAVEAEAVLEPGAPAALDRDAEDADVPLLGEKLLDLLRRPLGDGQERGGRRGALGDLHCSHRSSGPPR